MPLWVHSPASRREGLPEAWYGPYDESRFLNIRTFTRIRSQHSDRPQTLYVGGPRRGSLQRLRTYERGRRVWPEEMTTPMRRAQEKQILARGTRRRGRRALSGLAGLPRTVWTGPVPMRCNICDRSLDKWFVDGKTRFGPWAIMCLPCHGEYGVGTGTGRGQRFLITREGGVVKVKG